MRRKTVIPGTGPLIEKVQEQFVKLDEVIASLQQLETEAKAFFPKGKGKHGRKLVHEAAGRKSLRT